MQTSWNGEIPRVCRGVAEQVSRGSPGPQGPGKAGPGGGRVRASCAPRALLEIANVPYLQTALTLYCRGAGESQMPAVVK